MVKPGQVATITYGNSCVVRVGADNVWTVQAAAPCTNGSGEIDLTNRLNQSGPGENGGTGTLLVLGGVAVGGGLLIGCLVSWCKHDDKKGASP
jgi:hypothetical protein